MPVDLNGGSIKTEKIAKVFFSLDSGSIPATYREVFEMFNLHGLNKLTFTIFVPLFESNTLTKPMLNQASLLNR
jgi:Ca2+-binding EF-hand superfamily protein